MAQMTSALIVGVSSTKLTAAERAFLKDVKPAGLILFRRNVVFTDLVRPLVNDARDAVGRDDFLVLIDQEGGRVQRLKPPAAHDLPPAANFWPVYEADAERAKSAAFAIARLCAAELVVHGINMNCAPVLDVPVPGSHAIIGDRAYGADVAQVVALAREVANGLMAGGVCPVIKHIPGHGRATADSHLALPVVATDLPKLSATDFATFKALADMPAAMTAHVVFSAIDARHPASTSAKVTRDIIRGAIGFDGFLMSDDLGMHALKGPMRSRAEAVIAAGSDVALHCSGDMAEMRAAAEGVPRLEAAAAKRFRRCLDILAQCEAFERAASEEALAEALAVTAVA